jgi:hypothetical protein
VVTLLLDTAVYDYGMVYSVQASIFGLRVVR